MRHEDDHQRQADERRQAALRISSSPSDGAHLADLADGHRRGQRAGLEHQRQVLRLLEPLVVGLARRRGPG